MILHYDTTPTALTVTTACGENQVNIDHIHFTWIPTEVTCECCTKSKVFIKILYIFEIGCDGNLQKWREYVKDCADVRNL